MFPSASRTRLSRPQPSDWAKVELISASFLRPAARNPRTHSKKQIRRIADSIEKFGFINPIIIGERGGIIAGHARAEAANLLGMAKVPVIRVSHLSEAAVRAYALADNRLTELAGYDRELLATELEELAVLLPEIDLDLSITGFEPAEIDSLFVDFGSDRPDPADEIPDLSNMPVVSRPGDLFVMGRHRLFVGDARGADFYARLMRTETAASAFLDPPYNVRIAGHVGGRGRTKHREFKCASGEMTAEQFIAFLEQTLGLCAQYSADGAVHYICMDWRHLAELLAAGNVVYAELKSLCVWAKNNVGQGSFYRSQHELVFVFKHGTAAHLNTFELGQHGRMRSNVWHYAGVNTFRAGRMDELKMHPTVKPVALVVDAMRDCSRRGDIILDAFAGSGTTIMAAEQIGRRAYCMEIDAAYADVCVRRWQSYTKREAVLERSGQTFDDLAASRAASHAVRAHRGEAQDASARPPRKAGQDRPQARGSTLAVPRRQACREVQNHSAERKAESSKMSRKPTQKAAAAASAPRQRKDYEVGYGRPPKSGQFPPGRSGNPKGRPKGSRNFGTTVNAVMSHKIRLAGSGRKTIAADEALLREWYRLALKGNVKAGAYLLAVWAKYQQGQVAEPPDEGLSERDQEILQNFIAQFDKPKKGERS